MKAWFRSAIVVALCLAPALAQAQSADRQVVFRPGATSAELSGTIRGDADATLRLKTRAGQVMQVLFTPSNRSCYFNAFAPGSQDALHNGSIAGNEFGRNPTADGEYRFQIYLMRNAARRNETCRYRISFEVTGSPGGTSAGVPDRQMRDQCRARVTAMYAVQGNRVRMGAVQIAGGEPRIDGTVDKKAEGIKKFRCLYTPQRQLRDVMAMTPDGE